MKDSFSDLTYEEVLNKRDELKKRFLDLRFDMVIGHVENPLEKRTIRRKIARCNTILHEYALGMRKS
jgi:large subunit ribosomal protein L29